MNGKNEIIVCQFNTCILLWLLVPRASYDYHLTNLLTNYFTQNLDTLTYWPIDLLTYFPTVPIWAIGLIVAGSLLFLVCCMYCVCKRCCKKRKKKEGKKGLKVTFNLVFQSPVFWTQHQSIHNFLNKNYVSSKALHNFFTKYIHHGLKEIKFSNWKDVFFCY